MPIRHSVQREDAVSPPRLPALALLLGCVGAAALASPPRPARAEAGQPAVDIWSRDALSGDWGELRKTLEQHGVTIGLTYTGDALADLAGGIKRGAVYEEQVLGTLDIDLEKLLGWRGGAFHVSAYEYAGHALSEGYVGSIGAASGIEGPPPSVRLYTLWLQQKWANDRVSLKAGVLAMDEEQFSFTVPAQLFLAATFGYPDGLAADLPAGGPIYPLGAPAVLLDVKPMPIPELRAAVFGGDPLGGSGATFPEEEVPKGSVIALSGGALIAAEAVLTPNPQQEGVATRFRLGGWFHTSDRFADQRFAANGLSLADPASGGVPRDDSGDWVIYGTAETMLYRAPGTKDQGLAAFARIAALPAAQNPVSLYADGGLTYKGLLPGRPDDTVGIAVAYFGISPAAQALDRDTRRFSGDPGYPIRGREILLELTYQAQLTPWLRVQPDFQYVFSPSGGVPHPVDPARTIGNAAIFGLRTSVTF